MLSSSITDGSIGSSGRGGGRKKHEIYVTAFGGHLFYDLFLQGGGGGAWPPRPPRSATGSCYSKHARWSKTGVSVAPQKGLMSSKLKNKRNKKHATWSQQCDRPFMVSW